MGISRSLQTGHGRLTPSLYIHFFTALSALQQICVTGTGRWVLPAIQPFTLKEASDFHHRTAANLDPFVKQISLVRMGFEHTHHRRDASAWEYRNCPRPHV